MDSFDRWLEFSLQQELRPAYGAAANPAQARYRQSLLTRGIGRRSRAVAKLAPVMAGILALGTVGAEAAGYGPVHVGRSGLYVKIGTVPATPNPPVLPPTPEPSKATESVAPLAPTPDRQDTSPGETAAPHESAQPSESPEPRVSQSGSPEPYNLNPASSGSPEPSDH